ncbi:MAG: hypothetical protein WCA76_17705 [Candidatus Sulfotelmatobacter sp.]|jgi:hypothetical protein
MMPTDSVDYNSIATKLLEKTKAGKIEWKERGQGFGEALYEQPVEVGFVADLGEGFSFEVSSVTSRGDTSYSLSMSDDQGHRIFTLALADDPDTMINRPLLYETLTDLYDIARRKALKVDEKIGRVSAILERI